jgi:hypothetical protein
MERDTRFGRRRGLPAAAIGMVALMLGLFATEAPASTWTVRQLPGEAAKIMMFGVSCPTTSLCVAVGGNNSIASSTNPTGPASSWNVVYPGEGAIVLGEGGFFNGRQLRGVSCPSPQLCVAVGFEGLVFTTTNPTGPGSSWTPTDLSPTGPNLHFYGVSCPSPTFCAASAGRGKIAVTTNPAGGPSAWTVSEPAGSLELRGISCLGPQLCVAVGDDGTKIAPEPGQLAQVLSSTSPLTGPWGRVAMPGGQGSMYGVSCPSPGLCVSGNMLGDLLVATGPTGPASSWQRIDGGGAVQITAADCISTSACVAVDNNADVLTSTDPTAGPGAWTFTNMAPYPMVDETELNGTFGVSCTSTALCAVAGAKGQIFTSANPFEASATPIKKVDKKRKKKHRKRPKRPRVTIARGPSAGIEIDGRRVHVRTFFYARHHVQVRGFLCQVDDHRARRCRSPKGFTVGLGKHVFRVRAIGWTGLKGPEEKRSFEVCHPTFPPQCAGKPVSEGAGPPVP